MSKVSNAVPELRNRDDEAPGQVTARHLLADARTRHTTHTSTALTVATSASADVIEALRSKIGTEVSTMHLRRAGSSVMVDVDLLPAPRTEADGTIGAR